MAGKKKLTKINSAIRRFFDDAPFDEGIERVDEATLVELTHFLGIIPDDWDKQSLVRIYRRLWSDADLHIRKEIVDFFKAQGKVYHGVRPMEPTTERTEKIAAIIEEMDVTKSEALLLHNAFIDVRTKKITREKMEAKLAHLRFDVKKKTLEKALEGHFDLDDRFVFNHAFTYALFGETFKKIQPVATPVFSYTYLSESDPETIIAEIGAIKKERIEATQRQIDAFLAALKSDHPYLPGEAMVAALKASPPGEAVTLPPLGDTLLLQILKAALQAREVEQSDHDVVVTLDAAFEAPYLETPIRYALHFAVDKAELLKQIWSGAPLELSGAVADTKTQYESHFADTLESLLEECRRSARLLQMDETELHRMIYSALLPLMDDTLTITPKMSRKVLYAFHQEIQQALIKRQRQELLARTIRDFKNLFPLARGMRRRLIFHTGPTNSGKTYQAMQALKSADTGYYLAPLRLLALEGYEYLQKEGVPTSLITGEEQLLDEEATHVSSTIEMLNFEVDVDVCVIDEVQMLDDRDRGWAWANAIIGAPAATIIMTGSPNAVPAVQALADYLEEPLEIIEFHRKTPLELMRHATPIAEITPGTAVVAFSRKEVLNIKQQLARYFRVSVVYGNLSPEVRREEARRFRHGEAEVLVATDAIAMGLNLPIETLLFYRADKFDGENRRPLSPSEVQQIAGRAGRYGLSDKGYVGALKPDVLQAIHKLFPKPAKTVAVPFNVSANLEHIKLVGAILEEESLEEILRFFVKNMHFNGPFKAINLESMLEASQVVDRYRLDLPTKYHLACAPVTFVSPYIAQSYERYVRALEQGKPVAYIPPAHLGPYATSMEQLLEAEDRVKEISLYLWLSYRFPESFIDAEKAREFRGILNHYIEASLKEGNFIARCRECTKPLPLNSPYAICQSCFRRLNRQKRGADRGRSR